MIKALNNAHGTAEVTGPPILQLRDMPAAWLTIVTASCYSLSRNSASWVSYGILAGGVVLALLLGEWVIATVTLVAGVALMLLLIVLVPIGTIVFNSVSRSRRIWAQPGGRAVVTAKKIPGGWEPNNASARPVRSGTATELLQSVVDYADETGAKLVTRATNRRVAELYRDRWGFVIGKTYRFPGSVQVSRERQAAPEDASSRR
ncbi:hypothetical protein [Arthrobacter woluwensis]|uniref:Uncharacterized protein n=1 Tax=Arthrobacter woluwensis TaxID=156980 RepID=A0A1H4I9D3_9MICC|nr:hypothetical protein [Arthrobacter woluwensis]SEB29968.1 hypothetical protein SAMN04489745_0097 [Arthrobacter woluwensis]